MERELCWLLDQDKPLNDSIKKLEKENGELRCEEKVHGESARIVS